MLLHVRQDVGINILREGDGCMTEPFGDDFHRHAAGQEAGRVAVAQIVKAHGRQFRLFQQQSEFFVEIVRVVRPPVVPGPAVASIFIEFAVFQLVRRLADFFFFERFDGNLGEFDVAFAAGGFNRVQVELAADPVKRVTNVNRGMVGVNVFGAGVGAADFVG